MSRLTKQIESAIISDNGINNDNDDDNIIIY
jgi:hypothetical protein